MSIQEHSLAFLSLVSTETYSKRTLVMLGACFLCLSAIATSNEQKPARTTDVAKYDKTIADARVVLVEISSVHMHVFVPTNSASNSTATTNLAITYITEHIGTNSSKTPATGSVLLYLHNKRLKELSMDFNGIGCSMSPDIDIPPPWPQVEVTDKGACYTYHVVMKGVHYPAGARVDCLIRQGFDGHLNDFRFNDTPLPSKFINIHKHTSEQ